jgi:transposase-like protein
LILKQTKRLKRDRLTHDVLAIETSRYKAEAIARTCIKVHLVEESLDCPDCFDTMMKLYDWDKVRYRCENCGLIIANPLSTYTVEEQEIK